MTNLYNVEAEYHMDLYSKGKFFGYRVKALIRDDDLAFFINGMVVSPPECNKEKIWQVYTPKQGNARIVEFDGKKSKLWHEIKDACLNAVWEHLRQEKLDATDNMDQYDGLSSEEFNKKMLEGLDRAGF